MKLTDDLENKLSAVAKFCIEREGKLSFNVAMSTYCIVRNSHINCPYLTLKRGYLSAEGKAFYGCNYDRKKENNL
jgi:hypothetical protein